MTTWKDELQERIAKTSDKLNEIIVEKNANGTWFQKILQHELKDFQKTLALAVDKIITTKMNALTKKLKPILILFYKMTVNNGTKHLGSF